MLTLSRIRAQRLLSRIMPSLHPREHASSELSTALQAIRSELAEVRDEFPVGRDLVDRFGGVERAAAEMLIELGALQAKLSAVDRLEQQLAEVRTLAAEGRDMITRTYDRLENGPRLLVEVRAARDYEQAWSEDEPLVSVVIPTYNGAELLCDRALASVRAQTYQRWEAIVVGDACTDDAAERVASIGDERIRFMNLPVRGPYPDDPVLFWRIAGTTPYNVGCRNAVGRWLASLGHDDTFEKDHIEVLLAQAQRDRAELVYGQLRMVEEVTGRELRMVGRWPPELSHIGIQGAIYHRGLAVFEYDLNSRFAGEPNDWNFTRRLWEAGARFVFLERPVTTYHYTPKDPPGRAWLRSAVGEED